MALLTLDGQNNHSRYTRGGRRSAPTCVISNVAGKGESPSGRGTGTGGGVAYMLVDDPVVSEYVNRMGQNMVRISDARVPVHDQGD